MGTDRRYTGQRWEAGIGLYDYNARYYDPALGRFVQADTIVPSVAHSQDFNRYSYVRGNPLIYVDKNGHNPIYAALVGIAVGTIFIGGLFVIKNAKYTRIMSKEISPVYKESSSDAAFLVNLFASDKIKGKTARKRLARVLEGTTELLWFGCFGGDFGDSGFRPELQDGGDQVGHFLTAVSFGALAERGWLPTPSWFKRLATGHEIVSDGDIWGQIKAGNKEARDLFQQAIDADIAGDFEARNGFLTQILEMGMGESEKRPGNSLADLILSVRGWRFGQMIMSGEIKTREEAATWLRENVQTP
jgi:RHS repeat-associated protein